MMIKNIFTKLKESLPSTRIVISVTIFIVIILFLLYFQSTMDPMTLPKPGVTEVHYADNITDAHLMLIEKFNKEYTGRIKVVPINLPFSKFSTNERKELLARSLRSKSEKIDIFAVDIIWGYRFAKWAENLDGYFQPDYLSSLIKEILPTAFYNDTLIALPLTIDLGTMYYREDLLKNIRNHEEFEKKLAESITWSEFINTGILLNGKIMPYYLYPAADYEGLICSYMELVLNQNRAFFDNGMIDLTKPESVKALNTLVNLIHNYKLTPGAVTSMTEFPCHEYYFENNGLFLRSWPTFQADYNKFFKIEHPDIEIKRAPLPHFRGTEPAAVFGGWNLIVSKFSENKNAAVEFIKFLLKPESQQTLFIENGSLPVLKELYEEDRTIENKEVLQYYKEQFKYGVHRPLLIDYTKISDIISYYVHKALTKELTVTEALNKATEMINTDGEVVK